MTYFTYGIKLKCRTGGEKPLEVLIIHLKIRFKDAMEDAGCLLKKVSERIKPAN
jgi:hypothetical protein